MAARERTLLIRADAGVRMGTGHVMRCLALAQAWQDAGGDVLFVSAASTPGIDARLRDESMEMLCLPVPPGSTDDACETARIARRRDAACVVDGYHFGGDYQRAIRRAGVRLLAIDDHGHAEHYWADLVLNQNIHAHPGLYRRRQPGTRLLLGSRYVLLRREFRRWAFERRIPPVARRVLVTMGGSDPDNATLQVLEALEPLDIEGLAATVIAGSSNPHLASLRAFAATARISIRLERGVTDMPKWMAWCDAAITSAGSTTWELAHLGVPGLTLILADNQERSARLLAERGVFATLGWASAVERRTLCEATRRLLLSPERRKKQSDAAAALVDAQGVIRVMENLVGQGSLS